MKIIFEKLLNFIARCYSSLRKLVKMRKTIINNETSKIHNTLFNIIKLNVLLNLQ